MVALSSLRSEQPHVVEVLSTAVSSDRLHHAYLLAGPEEAGAPAFASALASSLVCNDRQEADGCGECAACRKHAGGNHPDVIQVAPDEKGKISIDTVRALSNRLSLRAAESETKVAIIEQADAMKPPAQNALLKTLEEPPGATCFILTTARVRMMLPTVRSRCQTLRLVPRRREGAWQALVEAGIDNDVARPLAALVGPDPARAQVLLDKGADEIVTSLRQDLAVDASLAAIIHIAGDLGADRERADLALAILEVEVRDRLARARGAGDDLLYTESDSEVTTDRLSAAAERLMDIRRFRVLNINRTMALETVLLAVTGHVQPHLGRTP
jgi:DNA polymerase-3 subunit delta'